MSDIILGMNRRVKELRVPGVDVLPKGGPNEFSVCIAYCRPNIREMVEDTIKLVSPWAQRVVVSSPDGEGFGGAESVSHGYNEDYSNIMLSFAPYLRHGSWCWYLDADERPQLDSLRKLSGVLGEASSRGHSVIRTESLAHTDGDMVLSFKPNLVRVTKGLYLQWRGFHLSMGNSSGSYFEDSGLWYNHYKQGGGYMRSAFLMALSDPLNCHFLRQRLADYLPLWAAHNVGIEDVISWAVNRNPPGWLVDLFAQWLNESHPEDSQCAAWNAAKWWDSGFMSQYVKCGLQCCAYE